MDNLKAYGAGLAGGQFDAAAFVRKPSVICRIAAGVLGGLTWLAMNKGGWHRGLMNIYTPVCLFNNSSSTCSFVSAMGFFSIAGAIALLFTDAQFDKISAVQTRSRVVRADLGISAIFSGVFLLSFFNTLAKYSKTELNEPFDGKFAKLAIFLQLLSAIAWGGAAFLAWRRYQAAAAEDTFTSNNDYGNGDFQGIAGDVAEGYGYGGNSDGIGSTGGDGYHSGGVASGMTQMGGQMAMGQGGYQANPFAAQQQQTNPFAGQPGYQY